MPLPGHHQPKGCRRWRGGDAMALKDLGRSVIPMLSRGADYTHHISTCPTEFSDFPMALHRVDDIKRLLDILWLGMMPYCRSWESMSSSSQLEILVWILALHYELDRTKNIHKFNFASHTHGCQTFLKSRIKDTTSVVKVS